MLDSRPHPTPLTLGLALGLALGAPLGLGACSDEAGELEEGGDGSEFVEAHSNQPHDEKPQIDASEAEILAADNHALTFDLYHELRVGQAATQGFSISALSIQTAFGMLYAGTVDPAREEMAATLHFSLADERQHVVHNWLDAQLTDRNLPATSDPGGDQGAVDLHIANGVWVLEELGDQISTDYLDTLATHYDAGVYLARFDTQPEVEREAINAWVAARTADLIPELFPMGVIDTLTRLVLVNAVYLKAPWARPFLEGATAQAPFTRLDGTQTQVDMMHHPELPAEYGEGPGYQAIALPLRGKALELVIVLPDDFAAFEAGLDAASFASLREGMSPAVVDTRMPRFELEAQLELTNELLALGMIAPFVDDHSFDAILEGLGVITAVVHQTVIKVDEKGVEAAAATGIVVSETAVLEPDATIVVDRPFLLAIRDAPTDTLLFFGRVLEP